MRSCVQYRLAALGARAVHSGPALSLRGAVAASIAARGMLQQPRRPQQQQQLSPRQRPATVAAAAEAASTATAATDGAEPKQVGLAGRPLVEAR